MLFPVVLGDMVREDDHGNGRVGGALQVVRDGSPVGLEIGPEDEFLQVVREEGESRPQRQTERLGEFGQPSTQQDQVAAGPTKRVYAPVRRSGA